MLNFIAKHAIFTLSFATFLDTIDNMFFTPDFKTYEHLTFFNDSGAFKRENAHETLMMLELMDFEGCGNLKATLRSLYGGVGDNGEGDGEKA